MARQLRAVPNVVAGAVFQPRSLILGGKKHSYAVYVPPDYSKEKAWPVVLFLHGAGERGNDGLAQTTVGIGPALQRRSEPYPAVVVMPQCPRGDHWVYNGRAIAMRALHETEQEFHVDTKRVALTGISMGGAGAWVVASEHPDHFAALAPICGWVSGESAVRSIAGKLRDMPVWMFHGSEDNIVPVDGSRVIARALREAGSNVQYTELPGVKHNSWDMAYQESELLDWLLLERSR